MARDRRRVVVVAARQRSLLNFRRPLISELLRRGYTVETVAPDETEEYTVEIEALGATFARLPLDPKRPIALGDALAARRIAAMARPRLPEEAVLIFPYAVKPIIVSSVALMLNSSAALALMFTGLGVPFSRLLSQSSVRSAVVRSLLRRVMGRADAVITQNVDDMRNLDESGFLPDTSLTKVVPGSGVDTKHFSPKPMPTEPRFLYCGRMRVDKGVIVFLEAVRSLRVRKGSGFHVDLVGPMDDEANEDFRRRFASLVEATGAEYHGFREDVRPFLWRSSVLVCPSWYPEGIPRIILEAMACGRGVIAADTAGTCEPVSDGWNGCLVIPKSVESLAGALAQVLEVPDTAAKWGEEARHEAEVKFDATRVADMIADVFDTLLGAG